MSALMYPVAGSALALLLSSAVVPSSRAESFALAGPRPRSNQNVAHAAQAGWIPGFWDLRGDPRGAVRGGWVYVAGQWVVPPVPGARWAPGDWGWDNDWWSWTPGHWELPLKHGQPRKST